MPARTVNQTMSGATLGISATLPATYDAAGYGTSGPVFTTVGQIENFGAHGMTANVPKFTAVADAIVQKFKGSKDYGTIQLSIGHVPGDAGQVILAAASESQNRYSAKITYPTGTGESTPEIHYLDVLITVRAINDGAVDDIRKAMVTLEVCRKPVEVAAT